MAHITHILFVPQKAVVAKSRPCWYPSEFMPSLLSPVVAAYEVKLSYICVEPALANTLTEFMALGVHDYACTDADTKSPIQEDGMPYYCKPRTTKLRWLRHKEISFISAARGLREGSSVMRNDPRKNIMLDHAP